MLYAVYTVYLLYIVLYIQYVLFINRIDLFKVFTCCRELCPATKSPQKGHREFRHLHNLLASI